MSEHPKRWKLEQWKDGRGWTLRCNHRMCGHNPCMRSDGGFVTEAIGWIEFGRLLAHFDIPLADVEGLPE